MLSESLRKRNSEVRDRREAARAAAEEKDGVGGAGRAHGTFGGDAVEGRAREIVSDAADATADRDGVQRWAGVFFLWTIRSGMCWRSCGARSGSDFRNGRMGGIFRFISSRWISRRWIASWTRIMRSSSRCRRGEREGISMEEWSFCRCCTGSWRCEWEMTSTC